MKRLGITTFALLTLVAFVAIRAPQPAYAQRAGDTRPKGELRGKFYDSDGTVAQRTNTEYRLFLSAEPTDDGWRLLNQVSEGEYFYFKNLKPGTYDLHLRRYSNRPVHIYGIVVKAGRPTLLQEIEMQKGDTLLESGTPVIQPVPAILVADELERLRKEIADLKSQIAELKARK